MKHTVSLLVFLYCASPYAADTSAIASSNAEYVRLDNMLAPLPEIAVFKSGILVEKLKLVACGCNRTALITSYQYRTAKNTRLLNEPCGYVWILDPKKEDMHAHIEHIPTSTRMIPFVEFDEPARGDTTYCMEMVNEKDASLVKYNHITTESSIEAKELRIVCLKPVVPTPLQLIEPLTNIKRLMFRVARLVGKNALEILCENLPHITELHIEKTKLDCTELSIAHNKLSECTIYNCGLTSIKKLELRSLLTLSLPYNKLTEFNIHQPQLNQRCHILLLHNAITKVYTSEPYAKASSLYIDVCRNPLKVQETYKGIFKKNMPTTQRQPGKRREMLVHDTGIFYRDGSVEQ